MSRVLKTALSNGLEVLTLQKPEALVLEHRVRGYLQLGACMKHHDLHHVKPTRRNYASSLTLWDLVFGTIIDETRA